MRKHTKALATIMAAATLAMASAVTSLANTGWLNVQNKWYYYDEAGNSVRNQWVENDNDLFWLKDNGEMAIQSWVNYENSWYWVNAQGAMVTDSWIPITNNWYYVGQDGKMLANTWFEYNNRSYYLTESGAAAKGWVELDGKWYYFDRTNGDMKKSTTIDGYTVNKEGVYVKQFYQLQCISIGLGYVCVFNPIRFRVKENRLYTECWGVLKSILPAFF